MKIYSKKVPDWLAPLLCLLALVFLRRSAMDAVQAAVDQCLRLIVPSLFPFFVVVNLLVHTQLPDLLARRCRGWMVRGLHANAGGAGALVLSFLGGYPAGAATVAALQQKGSLGKRDAERLLVFCNNTGPAIFFGLIGGCLYDSAAAPLALYLLHIASAMLTGLLLRPNRLPEQNVQTCLPAAANTGFPGAVLAAFRSTAQICAFVIVFQVLLGMLEGMLLQVFPAIAEMPVLLSILAGVTDLPNGIRALQDVSSPVVQFVLASVFANWAGLCIHLQTQAAVQQAGLSLRWHLRGKLVQSAVSLALSVPVAFALQGTVPGCTLLGPVGCAAALFWQLSKTRVEIPAKTHYNRAKAG